MTVLVRRVVPLAVLASLCAFVVRLNAVPAERSDLWMHLRMGSEFLSGWSISAPGNLGAYDTASWIPTQWLSQVGMAWAEGWGGLTAVLTISAVVQASTLAVLYLACRQEGSPLASTVACLACFTALAAAFTPRPQIASYLLFAVSVAAWRRSERSGRAPLWLIPLTWLWVTIHGMWPIGIALGLVMAAGLALDGVAVGRQRMLAFAVPISALVLASVTPLGPRVFEGVVEVGSRRAYFAEWAAPDFTDIRAVGVLAMAGVVLIATLRRAPLRWTPLLYLGFAIGLAIFSFRTVPLAAIMLAPVLTQVVQRGLPDADANPPARLERLVALAGVVVVGTAVAVTTSSRSDQPPACVLARRASERHAVRHPRPQRLGHRGLLPVEDAALDLAMHGYADVFTTEELERNVNVVRIGADWDRDVADMDADYALLEPDSPLALRADPPRLVGRGGGGPRLRPSPTVGRLDQSRPMLKADSRSCLE